MSNTDSFIEEVTEEVQRDKLYATLKRWGWVAGLGVVLLVGGAAFNEWRKASDRAAAQSFGDDILARVDQPYADGGLSDLVIADPAQAAIAGHLAAAQALTGDDRGAALAELNNLSEDGEVDTVYRELAALKAALALAPDTDVAERVAAFDAITGPFRPVAQEAKAYALIASGDRDGAVAVLRELVQSADATGGLQRRASEMIVALGAEISDSDS